MSGPVRPPLTVAESDGTPTVRPVNTIAFNSADFVVTDNGGATVRIDLASSGTGASLTQSFIGFGDSSNLLTGSANFTFVDESGDTGPTVTMTGDKPIFIMQDDTSATDFFSEFTQSGASLELRSKNSAGASVEIFRTRADSITFNDDAADMDTIVKGDTTQSLLYVDAGQDNVGINCVPDSTARFHVSDAGGKAATVRIESTDADADVGPTVQLFRNSGSVADGDSLGSLIWKGKDSAGNSPDYAKIYTKAEDTTNEDADMRFEIMRNGALVDQFRIRHSQAVVNESAADVDFRVETASDTHAFQVDPGRNSVGIGIQGTQSSKLTVEADGAFDPTTSTLTDMDNTIHIDSSAASAGQGNYGGALTFSGVGSSRRRAGIAVVQTTSDQDETGLAFFTHDPASPSTDETLNEHMRLDDNGRLIISDTDIGTDTTSARLMVRRSSIADAPTLLLTNSATPDASNSANQLHFSTTATTTTNGSLIGSINYFAKDSAGNEHEIAKIETTFADKGTGTEDGVVAFYVTDGGTDNVSHLVLGNGRVTVNEGGEPDIDFRVEGNTKTHLLTVDASQDNVGVGATPSSSLVADPVLQVPNDAGVASYIYQTASTTSPMTLTDNDLHSVLIVHASASALTINLPADVGIKGQYFRFVSTSGNVTISPSSIAGDTINGGTADLTRSTDYQVYECICIANNTWVLSNP